jgi:hypothetical protein
MLITKFGKAIKTGPSDFLFWTIWFWQVQRRIKAGAKLEDLKMQGCFKAWKMIKKYQRAKIEEIQAESRGRKN